MISSNIALQKKEDISTWLKGGDQSTWTLKFCDTFDVIFGKRHLSFKCFIRSSLLSFAGVIILYFILDGYDVFGEQARISDKISLLEAIMLGALFNLIPDYISLFETRWLLKRFSNVTSFWKQAGLLLLDLIFSALIIGSYIIIFLWIFRDIDISFMKMIAIFSVYSIFFYSTFITSFSAWLYCLSTWILRLISETCLKNWLDIDEKPIQQIGLVSAVILFFSGVIISPLVSHESEGTPNYIELLACDISPDTCINVAGLTKDEERKLALFSKACFGGMNKECVHTGLKTYGSNIALSMELFRKACQSNIALGCFYQGVIIMDEVETMEHRPPLPPSDFFFIKNSELHEAEIYFKKTIKINPKEQAAYLYLIESMRQQGKYAEAEKYNDIFFSRMLNKKI